MTNFQADVTEKLKEIVHDQDGSISCSPHDCEPNELVGHEIGDVYIKALIKKNDLSITAYIYTDEASMKTEGHNFMFELLDYKKDSNILGKVLINFIQIFLEGEAPVKALEKARNQNGLPS